jgi:outer membrane lipoprotein-sorting protein
MRRIDRRRARYAVPVVVAGAIALAASIPSLTAGASTPDLPPITAQQLITKVEQVDVPALEGTVQWTADLGLPDVSGLVSGNSGQVASSTGFDPTTLLAGSHSIEVWSDGDRQRLALPRSMAETDLVRDGSQAWLYDSSSQHVTHYLPSSSAGLAGAGLAGAGLAGAGLAGGGSAGAAAGSGSGAPALTPDQEAAKVLADLTPSTEVDVSAGADVAGQHTYLLVLSPKPGTPGAASTTLDRITISVDAANGLPLDVSVYGKGVTDPVIEVQYSSVSFATPAASNFAAPVGISTTTTYLGGHAGPKGAEGSAGTPGPSRLSASGPPWAWVVSLGAGGAGLGSKLDSVTTPVSGSFGTGRLLQTNLVNVLFLPDGRGLAGFVSPAALEAAAGSATR